MYAKKFRIALGLTSLALFSINKKCLGMSETLIPGTPEATLTLPGTPQEKTPSPHRRRKSVCIFGTHAEKFPSSQRRRMSVCLSEMQSDSDNETELGTVGKEESFSSLTSCLPLATSPREKSRIEKAIGAIQNEPDPSIQARMSTILLANLQLRTTQKTESRMNETTQKTQAILKDLEAGIGHLQETDQQITRNLEDMLATHKRLRRMSYISLGFGLCGFALFTTNYILQNYTTYEE